MPRAFFASVLLLAAFPMVAFGQPGGRGHIYLPTSYGATPVSTIINSQAAYIAATGDFLESAANARLTRAIAADKELDNSVKWVSTYFERREINRRYTKGPSYLERETMRNAIARSLVESKFQTELKGDVTDKLNWMLRELNALAPAQRFIPGGQDTLVDSASDPKLSSDDIHHIRLSDGGHASGGLLLFHADSKESLETRWPRVLRDPAFEEVRLRFEWTRDNAVRELNDLHELSYATGERLMASVDALSSTFNAAYPPKRRIESSALLSTYIIGKKFLQSLALTVFRVIETEDHRAFDGSYRFQGDSVADLIGHMHKFGLEFGPAEPGGEGVYRKLFFAIRDFYKQLAAESGA